MDVVATALLLFIVLDPLGNIPLYLSQLKAVPEARRRRVAIREVLIAWVVLVFFFFAGAAFMKLLALEPAAVKIAGGVILFIIALRMIFPEPEGLFGHSPGGEPLIVPLAIPAVAGPGALSVVLLLRETNPESTWALFGAVNIAWAASALILVSSTQLFRILKESGIVALERLMGLLLVMIAVQMFLDALKDTGFVTLH
ncbi:MAG: MarC family protein [Gammaproteobacteria bacterium]